MEILEKKAEKILSENSKFCRYNAKYIFQNSLEISKLYIKSQRDLAKDLNYNNRHNKCYEKCITEIKKINAYSLVEIDKSKQSGKLYEKTDNVNREELLLILDNYRDALNNLEKTNEYESEAIIIGNIVKIKYKYLDNTDYNSLRRLAEQCIQISKLMNQNLEQFKWYLEITSILNELRKRFEDQERFEQETFENKFKNEKKQIFDEIAEARKKSNVEFIKFILQNHPPKKSPVKKNKTVEQLWENDKKSFLETLSARYNPDKYPKNTDDEKLKYTIYHTISSEINAILSDISNNTKI
jgi:hypothetical protein